MDKYNILQLITGLGMGGAEKVVLDLTKHIDRENFEISVVSLTDRIELLDDFRDENINTTVLFGQKTLISFLYLVKKVNKYVKDNKIQLIHAHMTHALVIASVVKVLNPKIKIVYTSHNLNIGSRLRELLVWFLKPYRNIDIIFSKDILKFFYKKNHIVIPNGINLKKYDLNLKKHETFTITCVGRLEYVKNHEFLINLADKLKNEFEFKIQVVGTGVLESKLKSEVEKLKLENYIIFLGLRNDIPQILSKSHCFVLPSLWEGLPIVLLEAGASKLPIVSTSVGSIPSLLNENTAYVCDLTNFKNAIIEIFYDYDNALKKADKLYERIDSHYAIDSILKEHEKVYINLLKKD